jgi:hypothetical protein
MFTRTKYFGLVLALVGILILVIAHAHFGSELPLMTGLFIILFTKEKVEDERAQQIRSKAVMIGFAIGYIFEVITTYLHSEKIIGFHLQHPRYFVIFVLALSVIIFYAKIISTGTVNKLHEEYN